MGTKAQVICPPDLGYSPDDKPSQVPFDATLIYRVEVTGIVPEKWDEFDVEDGLEALEYDPFKYHTVRVLRPGRGKRLQKGDSVKFNYSLYDRKGEWYESSGIRGIPTSEVELKYSSKKSCNFDTFWGQQAGAFIEVNCPVSKLPDGARDTAVYEMDIIEITNPSN